MKALYLPLAVSIAIVVCVVGCSDQISSAPGSTSSSITSVLESDKWLGKWNGPEGTFLQIEGGSGKYEITIQNLDGPRKFQGIAASRGILFERDGVKEVILASKGADTGMKWLAGKSNCLTIRMGEGYCQD